MEILFQILTVLVIGGLLASPALIFFLVQRGKTSVSEPMTIPPQII